MQAAFNISSMWTGYVYHRTQNVKTGAWTYKWEWLDKSAGAYPGCANSTLKLNFSIVVTMIMKLSLPINTSNTRMQTNITKYKTSIRLLK